MSDLPPWRPPSDPSSTSPAAPPPPPGPPASAEPPRPTLPPASPPGAPAPPPGADVPPPEVPPPGGVPPIDPTPAASGDSPRRGVGAVVAVIAVVAVLVGGAVFAIARLTGGESGGAASPEELGEQVFDAIEARDVLGMVDMLLPAERELFREPLIEFVDHLQRIEVLGPQTDLGSISGLDVLIDRRSVRTTPTNVDDITNLVLIGDVRVIVDGRSLPVGDLILDNVGDVDMSELDTRATEPFELPVTAVRSAGRWYLSAFYTIAETARADLFPVPDIPADGIEPSGGDTPEGALDALLAGVEALDLRRVVAALNPGEAAALQRYAPLFIDDAQRELDQAPLRWRITESEYTISGSGDSRRASIDALTIEGTVEGIDFSVEYVDGCVTARADGDEIDTCGDPDAIFDGDLAEIEAILDELPAVRRLIETVQAAFDDYEQPGILLRRTDGQWYVSPIGTLFDQQLAVMRALDRQEIEAIAEAAPPAFEELFGSFLFGGGVGFPDPWDDWPAVDDDWRDDAWDDDWLDDDAWLDDDDDWWDDDWSDDEWEGSSNPELDRCFGLPDVDAAVECFGDAIAAGTVESWEVPAELRFPECGAAEARWNGYYALGDDEFMQIVEAASPCFMALVAAGELDEWDVPLGFEDPSCFEGRNWYNVFDDEAYDDRFWDCLGY